MSQAVRSAIWFVVLVVLSTLLSPLPAYAGGWTLRRGPHFWFEFYWQEYVATRDFDQHGKPVDKVNDGRFRERRNEIKVELPSWHDRINFLGSVPVDFARYEDRNVTLTNRGGEEASIGVKWRVTDIRAPLIIALQPAVSFPLPGCDAADQPPLADCQTDVEGRLVASRPLRHDAEGFIAAYVNGEVGYRARRAAPTDEVPYFVESAWRIASIPVWAKGFVEGVASRAPRTGEQEEDYVKWTASIMLSRDPVTRDADRLRRGGTPFVEIGVGSIVAGRNTGVGRVVFVKLAYQL